MSKRASVVSFLRGNRGLSTYGRQYTLVGAMTAKWVLARRSQFDVNDIKMHRVPNLAPHLARSFVGEFLSSWEQLGHSGNSPFANELARRHPKLHDRVKKYWKGW